ncbi:MAG: riboflavin synthase [Chitinophagaceae bacterium]|nr:riboflavin synthase [Chitinophagaceae bacterium]MBL0200222.1 riboflavin synthase [Chitinophagaceae bacterium]
MFTGIIENTGAINEILTTGTNKSFWVSSPLAGDLKIDQSLSHNGVCLTIEEIKDGMHRVTAIEETLIKTNLGSWQKDDIINLERCMQMNGRLDGHIVQGHVDCTAECIEVVEKAGSWEYRFAFPEKFAALVIEKGSVCVNGISLTAFNVTNNSFSVAIIPYTFEHTNMSSLKKGALVNIEWDMIGKYVNRINSLK